MNGNGEKIVAPANAVKPVPPKNYKLLVDPLLTGKKEPKVYRYEGIVPGDPAASVVVRDPRNRLTHLSKRLEPLELPVSR